MHIFYYHMFNVSINLFLILSCSVQEKNLFRFKKIISSSVGEPELGSQAIIEGAGVVKKNYREPELLNLFRGS